MFRFNCCAQFQLLDFYFFEEIYVPDENSLQFNGSILVKKRGRTTGDFTGKLVNDCMYVRVYSTKVHGRYYEFKNCFAVKQKDETTFFDKGNSGSGVCLIDKKDNPLKRVLHLHSSSLRQLFVK